MVNKYDYIQRRGITLKSNRSRSLKMGPINRSYSRACVTFTSSGLCFVSKQLASTLFRRQVLSTLRWRGSSGNVRLSNLLISSCWTSWNKRNRPRPTGMLRAGLGSVQPRPLFWELPPPNTPHVSAFSARSRYRHRINSQLWTVDKGCIYSRL